MRVSAFKILRLFFLLMSVFTANAQDRLILQNGQVRKGQLVSVGKNIVYFNDSTGIGQYKRSEVLLAEDTRGTRYIFAAADEQEGSTKRQDDQIRRNSLGVLPVDILFGRITFMYERLSESGSTGIALPVSLTFDPFGPIFSPGIDSSNMIARRSGFSFITGVDVNFYLGDRPNRKFFIGPRLRYGTDLLLDDTEAYTLQTQIGWRFGKPSSVFSQHLSIGMGVARVLSSPASALLVQGQFYGWYSVNYRLGLNW